MTTARDEPDLVMGVAVVRVLLDRSQHRAVARVMECDDVAHGESRVLTFAIADEVGDEIRRWMAHLAMD